MEGKHPFASLLNQMHSSLHEVDDACASTGSSMRERYPLNKQTQNVKTNYFTTIVSMAEERSQDSPGGSLFTAMEYPRENHPFVEENKYGTVVWTSTSM